MFELSKENLLDFTLPLAITSVSKSVCTRKSDKARGFTVDLIKIKLINPFSRLSLSSRTCDLMFEKGAWTDDV